MKTIGNKTAIVVIVSFTALCAVVVLAVSRLPRTSHWQRYRQEYPEKAIRANLREVLFAAQGYMREHGVNEARYKDMVGNAIFLDEPIEPILGEDYNTLCVTGQDARIEVVTKDGKTIGIDFEPLGRYTAGPPTIPDLADPNR